MSLGAGNCPVCSTSVSPRMASCQQCGSDLVVHRLIDDLRKENTEMTNSDSIVQAAIPARTPTVWMWGLLVSNTLALVVVATAVSFGIWLNMSKTVQASVTEDLAAKHSEQIRVMTGMLKDTLDMVVEQRKENLALRSQVSQALEKIAENDKVVQNFKRR